MTDPETSIKRTCLVCGEPTSGCHFGIDACRGCGAFFRRTVIERKVYVCRTGGKCTVDKNSKPMCRKCRLRRCLDMGMQKSGVQVKTDDLMYEDASPLSLDDPIQAEEATMFDKIIKNYKELRVVRKATERVLDPEGYKTVETSGPLAGYSCLNMQKWLSFFRASTPDVIEFVANSVVGFNELLEKERLLLLKPFMVYFFWLDSGYRTYHLIPRHLYNKCCLITETTFIDVTRPDLIYNEHEIPQFLRNDVNKLLEKEMSGDRMRTLYMVDDLKIRDEEFAALVGYLFWNTSVEGCSEELHQTIKKRRAEVSAELERFYRRTKELNYFVRATELLNIQSGILMETMRSREDMEVFKIFEGFEHFDSFYQMIRDAQ